MVECLLSMREGEGLGSTPSISTFCKIIITLGVFDRFSPRKSRISFNVQENVVQLGM